MADYYSLIKHLHMSCALLSIILFVWRGSVLLTTGRPTQLRCLRWLPHLVDTLLLAGGIVLAIIIHQYPGVDAWLTAKVVALFVYIGLGLVTLRFAHSRATRSVAFVAAIATYAYIVGAAIGHSPWSWWQVL